MEHTDPPDSPSAWNLTAALSVVSHLACGDATVTLGKEEPARAGV